MDPSPSRADNKNDDFIPKRSSRLKSGRKITAARVGILGSLGEEGESLGLAAQWFAHVNTPQPGRSGGGGA